MSGVGQEAPGISFGELEAALSRIHGIADSKRTAFQARLKNLHRLSFPIGFATQQGKASVYRPGAITEMALALEMTQLGLPPERVVHVLSMNRFPTTMAIRMAANALAMAPQGFDPERELPTDPMSMYLFFDPSALRSLTLDNPNQTPDIDDADDTFFYGGQGVVRENIVKWTSGGRNRISLINVTAMIDLVASEILHPRLDEWTDEALVERQRFFTSLSVWADAEHEKTYDHDAEFYLKRHVSLTDLGEQAGPAEAIVERVTAETGLRPETVLKAITEYMANGGDDVGP